MPKNEKPTETENETAPAAPIEPAAPAARVQTVTAGSLVSDLAAAMPEPTSKAGKTDQDDAPAPANEHIDANGTPFDAKRHAVKKDGTPRIDKKGRFYSNALGRPHAGTGGKLTPDRPPVPTRPAPSFTDPTTGAPITSAGEPFAAGANAGPISDQFGPMAEMYLAMLYAPAVAIFSVEAKPDADQHEALKGQLTIALRHSGAKELNPWAGFALTLIAVGMTKIDKPTVRERWQSLKLRIAQIWNRMREKKVTSITQGET